MDVDTPAASEAGALSKHDGPKHNDMWTDDQIASLFKAVIRWKPAGSATCALKDEKCAG
jgi:DASH complex subunit ASK1